MNEGLDPLLSVMPGNLMFHHLGLDAHESLPMLHEFLLSLSRQVLLVVKLLL